MNISGHFRVCRC